MTMWVEILSDHVDAALGAVSVGQVVDWPEDTMRGRIALGMARPCDPPSLAPEAAPESAPETDEAEEVATAELEVAPPPAAPRRKAR